MSIHSSISLSHFLLLLNFQTHRICEGRFFYASNWCYVLIVWSHEKCINKIWRNLITAEFVKFFIWESRPKNKKEKSPNCTTFKQIYKYLNIFESLVNVCWISVVVAWQTNVFWFTILYTECRYTTRSQALSDIKCTNVFVAPLFLVSLEISAVVVLRWDSNSTAIELLEPIQQSQLIIQPSNML